VPAGCRVDDERRGEVTVSASELNAVIGAQGTDDSGNNDEYDFDKRLGSIAWEKRTEAGVLQGGATFEISPDPSDGVGIMTVVDNGANDADTDAGQILVTNVRLGTYTVTETVAPAGFALDDGPARDGTPVADQLHPAICARGTDDTGNPDESHFPNPVGSIALTKRPHAGSPHFPYTTLFRSDPSDGVGIMTVVDNGANDADTDAGQILVTNVRLGTYTVTETVAPAGFAL